MRWRVKASRRQPNWFHACEVTFVDAADAHEAKELVEADPQLQVWAVSPDPTGVLERLYIKWKAACDAWQERNRTGESNLGQRIPAP